MWKTCCTRISSLCYIQFRWFSWVNGMHDPKLQDEVNIIPNVERNDEKRSWGCSVRSGGTKAYIEPHPIEKTAKHHRSRQEFRKISLFIDLAPLIIHRLQRMCLIDGTNVRCILQEQSLPCCWHTVRNRLPYIGIERPGSTWKTWLIVIYFVMFQAKLKTNMDLKNKISTVVNWWYKRYWSRDLE